MRKPSIYFDTSIFSAFWYDGSDVAMLRVAYTPVNGGNWNALTSLCGLRLSRRPSYGPEFSPGSWSA